MVVFSLFGVIVGSAITAYLGVRTYSITATLIPSAISFALAMCLLIRVSKLPHPYRSGGVVAVGAIVSMAVASVYLDSANWFTRFSDDFELVIAALLGAALFSVSVAISCIGLRFKTAFISTVVTFVVFAAAAFTALRMFQNNRTSQHLLYVIFLSSACFQVIVIASYGLFSLCLSREAPGPKSAAV